MTIAYATLYQLRAELGLGASQTSDDALLGRHLSKGSRLIDESTHRHFDPLREARAFDGIGVRELLFDDDLLAVVSVTNGDGAAVAATNYWLEPARGAPYYSIRPRKSSGVAWLDPAGDYVRNVTLDGLWGYHDRYSAAWADTLETVLADPLAAGATAITFTDADGIAADSDEPRIQAGNLIRFGPDDDGEMALVASVNYSTNAGVLVRGAQGTTAAAQAQGTKIFVFRPWANAHRALMRLATWTYRLKDVNFYERLTVLGSTQKVAPDGIPDDVLELLPVRVATG